MRILRALTERAQNWINENVGCEDWQLCAGGIAGDWRMIDNIAQAILEEGLKSSRRYWWQFWKPQNDFEVVVP